MPGVFLAQMEFLGLIAGQLRNVKSRRSITFLTPHQKLGIMNDKLKV